MFLNTKSCLVVGMLMLTACSAKIDSGSVPEDLFGKADTRDLQVSNEPLSGSVEGKAWKGSKAVALFRSGEYGVVIADEATQLTCANWFPLAPHVQFTVPVIPATYSYNGTSGGRLVNVTFPYTTSNGGGSNNILASKSQIDIDGVVGTKLVGRVAALSPVGTKPDYQFAGAFAAEICDGPSGPMRIEEKRVSAFTIAYSEAVKTSSGYEIRLMNKVPSRKCDTWDAWMMMEKPIKYVSIRLPAQVGDFEIVRGTLEYGAQATSSGWSTDYFKGSGKVIALNGTDITYSIDAKDVANLEITALGRMTTTLCK